MAGQWFSPGTAVSSINKTDRHDITNIVESGVKHQNPNPRMPIHVKEIHIFSLRTISILDFTLVVNIYFSGFDCPE